MTFTQGQTRRTIGAPDIDADFGKGGQFTQGWLLRSQVRRQARTPPSSSCMNLALCMC